MGAILKIEHLSKSFGGLKAVSDFSMDVEQASIHSLIGPNGAGKTTITNLICGEIHQNEGNIFFRDEVIDKYKVYQRAGKGIGRTYQNIRLFDTLTVMENLSIAAKVTNDYGMLQTMFIPRLNRAEQKERDEKAMDTLEFIGLQHLANEKVHSLPYGNRKVLEIGRALAANPKLILLDEPAAGLNPSERRGLTDIIGKIHEKGISVFMIEHNMDVIMAISNRITVLNFGKKIAEGTPKEIRDNPEVIKAYLGDRYKVKEV